MERGSRYNPESFDAESVGTKLAFAIEEKDLRSLRVREAHIGRLQSVNAITIIGASGVGKSTLGLRLRSLVDESSLENVFSIPQRVTTRAARADDNPVEGYSCTDDEFDRLIEDDKLAMYWRRSTTNDRYGMLHPKMGTFPIFVATSTIVKHKTLVPEDMLDTSLIVGIYAPDTVKMERVLQRSTDIDEKDLQYRFNDRAAGIIPKVDVVVKNFGRYQDRSAIDVFQLIKATVEMHSEK